MEWVEPPAATPQSRPVKYQGIADELRSRPGEWALVFEDAWMVMANTIMSGGLAAFRPRDAFEARAVRTHEREYKGSIYARYVPEDAREDPEPLKPAEKPVQARTEADIRADERERVAQRLESLRVEMWNGSERKVNNAAFLAQVVRGMS